MRKPWIALWWSAAFPGCGHLMLCKYFTGFCLIGWEFLVNIHAHVNSAIFYSMIGDFVRAKSVIDTRWFLLYMAVYIFAMWDCFSLTIELNKLTVLADRSDPPVKPVSISALELNFLDIRSAWNGAVWSMFTPGLGYLYLNRLPSGFLLMAWFIVVVVQSRLLEAIQASAVGDCRHAAEVLDPEWLLFLPSLIGFAVQDGYLQIQASNRLFKIEQARYFTENYQSASRSIPFGSERNPS